MPKVPHGSGLDERTWETEYLRKEGFGHWEVRAGVTEHGGLRIEVPELHKDWSRREHGWAEGFPIGAVTPPPSGCDPGQLDFSCAEASGHVATVGL